MFSFSPPYVGNNFQFDEHIFQMDWFNHQLAFDFFSFFFFWKRGQYVSGGDFEEI